MSTKLKFQIASLLGAVMGAACLILALFLPRWYEYTGWTDPTHLVFPLCLAGGLLLTLSLLMFALITAPPPSQS